MPKGMFTQGICVLVNRAVTLDEVEAALSDFTISGRLEGSDTPAIAGPSVAIEFQPDVNGYVAVDIYNDTWPDGMGDPQEDPDVFAAWSMGHFGPFAFPGGLARAISQSWGMEDADKVVEQHTGCIRIRCSYVFGADEDTPIMPESYDPAAELDFMVKVASSLLELPAAVCYFNPGGEVLRDLDTLRAGLNFAWSNDIPPLDVWSNIRLYNIDEAWALMDTVGNAQLDIPDLEACFHLESYEPDEVDGFLRNVTLYVLANGQVIDDGDTVDGPGDVPWQAHQFEDGLSDPPRPALRWFPMDDRPVPEAVASAGESE